MVTTVSGCIRRIAARHGRLLTFEEAYPPLRTVFAGDFAEEAVALITTHPVLGGLAFVLQQQALHSDPDLQAPNFFGFARRWMEGNNHGEAQAVA
jgi:hypothetical protein